MNPIGALMLVISLPGMASELHRNDTLSLGHIDASAIQVDVAASLNSNRQKDGVGKSSWGLGWKDIDGTDVVLQLQWGNTDFGSLTDSRFLRVSLKSGDNLLFSDDLTQGIDLNKGSNALKIKFYDDSELSWSLGSTMIAAAGSVTLPVASDLNTLYLFTRGSDLEISKLSVKPLNTGTTLFMTDVVSSENFKNPLSLSDSPEGLWKFLDRDTDSEWARPGGQYTLGVILDGNSGNYNIIYLDGAVANARKWKPGMLKGSLKKTPFMRHYDLQWVDSMFDNLGKDEECWASLSDDGLILTLTFPLDRSVLRFYRQQE